MAKLCKSCGGPLCPICGGCIQEGECGCHSHTAEVERLRDELSRAAGLAMALMAHVPDDLLVGNLRPRALAFCREWGELQGHVDGVRAEIQAERERCAAICDARSRMHNASGIVHTHSDQVRYLEAKRIAELIREQ